MSPVDLEALRSVLAAEHAAVYLYGVLGARTSQSAAPALSEVLRETWAEHRDRRDDLLGRVAAAGGEPVPPAAAYAVPSAPLVPGGSLETPAGVTAVAAHVEAGCATTYAAAVGTAAGDVRRLAIGWLSGSAVRELAFRGTPEMFPGAGEHADR